MANALIGDGRIPQRPFFPLPFPSPFPSGDTSRRRCRENHVNTHQTLETLNTHTLSPRIPSFEAAPSCPGVVVSPNNAPLCWRGHMGRLLNTIHPLMHDTHRRLLQPSGGQVRMGSIHISLIGGQLILRDVVFCSKNVYLRYVSRAGELPPPFLLLCTDCSVRQPPLSHTV